MYVCVKVRDSDKPGKDPLYRMHGHYRGRVVHAEISAQLDMTVSPRTVRRGIAKIKPLLGMKVVYPKKAGRFFG